MSIAITEDHQALAQTAWEFLQKREARASARALLEADTEELAGWWQDLLGLGWQGLHLPEAYGGSGYGLEELVVVVEQLGRAVAPGPFVPSVITSAVLAATADDATKQALLPGFADGTTNAGIALSSTVSVRGESASGSAVVLGGGLATLLVLPAGDDVVLVETSAAGVTVSVPMNLDPTRRSARAAPAGAPVQVR